MAITKIMIVDGHALFRETLALFLAVKRGLITIGMVASTEEAVQNVALLKPDMVLIGIEVRGSDSIQTAKKIKEIDKNTKVILLTDRNDEAYLLEAIQADIDAYIFKEFTSAYFLNAIDEVIAGRKLLDPLNTGILLKKMKTLFIKDSNNHTQKPILSYREIQILDLLVKGYTNKMIAYELMITNDTVRNHIAKIFSKLNCKTRIGAVSEARNLGIIA